MVVFFFLYSFFKSGLSYFVLNIVWFVVFNIDMCDNDVLFYIFVGKYFFVCCYFRGVFNKFKFVLKYNNIWFVDNVFDYLSLFWFLYEINLKEFILKLVMLIVLIMG